MATVRVSCKEMQAYNDYGAGLEGDKNDYICICARFSDALRLQGLIVEEESVCLCIHCY